MCADIASQEDFLHILRDVFPLKRLAWSSLAKGSRLAEEVRSLRHLEEKTWQEISFNECFVLHDCLEFLTPEGACSYLPAFLLHSWNVREADVLFEYLVSWLATPAVTAELLSGLTHNQRMAVCGWLKHSCRTSDGIDEEHRTILKAMSLWRCSEMYEAATTQRGSCRKRSMP